MSRIPRFSLCLWLLGSSALGADPDALRSLEQAVVSVVERVKPSVVDLKTTGPEEEGIPFELEDVFERWFPLGNPAGQLGTGFLIPGKGLILTAEHVVAGRDRVTVCFAGGEEASGRVLGRDPATDLALVKLDGASDPLPLELGDSDALRPGQWVIAIGSPLGMSQSVSVGVVSAMDRQGLGLTELESYIQTDAYIGPGSSGGPLLDLDGKVVGVCIGLSAVRDQVGPGFAIPSNMASAILPELEKPGQVPRGWLGVAVHADREPGSIVTKALIPGIHDLKEGDRILALDGTPVKDPTQLKRMVLSRRPGEEIQLSVMREGRSLNVTTALRDAQGASYVPKSKALTQDFFGAQLSLDPASGDMKVTRVSQGSQADVAGLVEKDAILEINGCMIGDWAEIREAIGVDAKGPVRVLLQRGLVTLDVEIAR